MDEDQDESSRKQRETQNSELLTVWETLSNRRMNYDSMLWQTPTLGMTAQAFLLTLSLAGDTSSLGRVTAASLSAAISLMVMQLMVKHRRHEMLDARQLKRLEDEIGLPRNLFPRLPHGKINEKDEETLLVDNEIGELGIGVRALLKYRSFSVWFYGQFLFLSVAVAIVATEVLGGGSTLTV